MLPELVAVLAAPSVEYNLAEVEQAVVEMTLRLQNHHHHIHQNHLVASFSDSLLKKVLINSSTETPKKSNHAYESQH